MPRSVKGEIANDAGTFSRFNKQTRAVAVSDQETDQVPDVNSRSAIRR